MARSIWKGAISFGLVSIPVALFTATENKTPKFRMLRAGDSSAIKYKKVAEADGKEVAWDDIVRGFEVEKGRYVVFTDEELETATVRGGTRIVDVVQFVEAQEIDPIYYRSSYYLVPEQTGLKAYRILLQALRDKNRVGIAKFALREKEYLATLRADENVLILETMFWPDEIRAPVFEELATEVEVRDEEVKMAEMIIDNLTRPFDADAYQDPTRGAIEELARKKIEGEEIVSPETPEPTRVLDLLEALKASVEATKEKRAAS
ncbi:MAG: Ku protein [Acidimicrobiia bacterium]|nr:Ku protein [Acidimicrobiia bacterium]